MTGGTCYDDCLKWTYWKQSERSALPIERRLAYRECQIEAVRVWCEHQWEGDVENVGDKLNGNVRILRTAARTLGARGRQVTAYR
jgi:hypothetical protein